MLICSSLALDVRVVAFASFIACSVAANIEDRSTACLLPIGPRPARFSDHSCNVCCSFGFWARAKYAKSLACQPHTPSYVSHRSSRSSSFFVPIFTSPLPFSQSPISPPPFSLFINHNKSKSSNFSLYLKIFLRTLLPSTHVTQSSIFLVTKNAASVTTSVPTRT